MLMSAHANNIDLQKQASLGMVMKPDRSSVDFGNNFSNQQLSSSADVEFAF